MKTYSSTVIADSISPEGVRLLTLEVTMPRAVAAELNTHRVLSKNAASSRARPVTGVIMDVWENPYLPDSPGRNQKGMQAGEKLPDAEIEKLHEQLLRHRDVAILHAFENLIGKVEVLNALQQDPRTRGGILYMELGFRGDRTPIDVLTERYKELLKQDERPEEFFNLHKQVVNRYLEPWMWHTVLLSGTHWQNFAALRAHPAADPAIYNTAVKVIESINRSEPAEVGMGEWHLPLTSPEEREQYDTEILKKISVGRCARLSYLTHHGTRDIEADIKLGEMLKADRHWSPFEHLATPTSKTRHSGNFVGWRQYREDEDQTTGTDSGLLKDHSLL